MPTQLSLRFDEVPLTCSVQERYHALAPCLAGKVTPAERARHLNLAYSTIMRWLQQFREKGMPGLFDTTQYPREPYTPERMIVMLLYFKCCAPKAPDRELTRVVETVTGHRLDHKTVGALLQRYFLWRYPEFRERIQYPIPADPQARLGEYAWGRCRTVDEAAEVHRQLIYDMNRLPHFAHRHRLDNQHSPLEVLGPARGREVNAATLHRAFSRMTWNRKADAHGFVHINRWKVYIEAGLLQTPIQVTYWDGQLRAEYQSHLLVEYRCRWDATAQKPKSISHPHYYPTPFQSRQMTLFDPLWVRDPIEVEVIKERPKKKMAGAKQRRLYLGPELVQR